VDITMPAAAGATFQQHPSFTVPVTCVTNASGARCTANTNVGSNGRAVVRVTMRPQGGGVQVTVSAAADAAQAITESNVTNNSDQQTLTRIIQH
jgi:hypothetical protein